MRGTSELGLVAALTGLVLALPGGAGPARAQGTPAGCGWAAKSDPDTANVAYPDESATYWVAGASPGPGTRLVIRGHYPRARYFSFHAYDAASRPVGGLADHEIRPDAGSANPFSDPNATPGGHYTVQIVGEAKPPQPEPNTLYAGGAAPVIYRVYVSDDPRDPAGGVPLPEMTLETADGAVPVPLHECEPLPPSTGGSVNEAIKEWSYPDYDPRVAPHPTAQNPPSWNRFYGVGGPGGGAFSNLHVAYGTLTLARQFGDVVVVRGRAPTFPDTRAGEPPIGEHRLRYWSICQNELATQRYVDCTPDHETLLDEHGYFTVVLSDPADRPKNATRENRVNWLPWGGAYYDGLVIYRHMLPGPGFSQAWQNVQQGMTPASVMGEYLPQAAYCPRERFEAGGWWTCLTFPARGAGEVGGCLNAGGRARGRRLGPAALGRTRARQRRVLAGARRRARRGDRPLLRGGRRHPPRGLSHGAAETRPEPAPSRSHRTPRRHGPEPRAAVSRWPASGPQAPHERFAGACAASVATGSGATCGSWRRASAADWCSGRGGGAWSRWGSPTAA